MKSSGHQRRLNYVAIPPQREVCQSIQSEREADRQKDKRGDRHSRQQTERQTDVADR